MKPDEMLASGDDFAGDERKRLHDDVDRSWATEVERRADRVLAGG